MHADQDVPNYGIEKMINIDLMKVKKANPFQKTNDSLASSNKRPMTIDNS